MPSQDLGLLAYLDALIELVADRRGLAPLPDGRLAAAEARVCAYQAHEARWFEVRNLPLWPRGGVAVLEHLEGVF